MVRVQRDLEGLDWTKLFKMFVKIDLVHFLGNGADEDVVREELLLVGTKKLSVEGKGTAWLAFDLEVAHLVTGVLELIGIFDADHGTVERLGDIIFDLGLLGINEGNTGLVLKDLGEFDGADVLLGKIVEVDVLRGFHGEELVFFVFFKFTGFCLVLVK